MDDLISRADAINAVKELLDSMLDTDTIGFYEIENVLFEVPSAQSEIIRCKDCKHNPKYGWFGCPMSHLSEVQRPKTAWCWKAERKTNE